MVPKRLEMFSAKHRNAFEIDEEWKSILRWKYGAEFTVKRTKSLGAFVIATLSNAGGVLLR